MKTNIVIGIGFISLAVFLTYLNVTNKLEDSWLDRIDKIASIVSLAIAVVSFANPFSNESELGSQSVTIGRNNRQVNIGQTLNGSVIIGDTSTSAEQRANIASQRIRSELLNNFNSLSNLIQTIEALELEEFWDKRRSNESELAYQDRAANEFRDYVNHLDAQINIFKFSNNIYCAFQYDISYIPEEAERIERIYTQQAEVIDSVSRLKSGLQGFLALQLTDVERVEQGRSLHQEMIKNAKTMFFHASAYFCLVAETEDIKLLADLLPLIGINNLQLQAGEVGYRASMELAARFSKEKTEVLRTRLSKQRQALHREITRRIEDPYLVRIREMAGLPPVLTKSELYRLQSIRLNFTEQKPEELFKLAAFSYLEMDGHAARLYFQRAIDTKILSYMQLQFAKASINRLKNPDYYENSVGLMVVGLTPGGNFEQSGLEIGDVIISFDKNLVNEPLDIASYAAKAKSIPILLKLIRDEQKIVLKVAANKPASAVLTQLIVFNAIQL